jgi:hypothetical protein
MEDLVFSTLTKSLGYALKLWPVIEKMDINGNIEPKKGLCQVNNCLLASEKATCLYHTWVDFIIGNIF